ncbi:MAG: hypothetical protein QMC83_00520 [Thermodesulfovibrionales bacterium]|nr:hypothetical protein [Thermodesulfovibrionales bacterium]
MRYSEIIGLHDYFESYYDLTNEHKTYWMRFIPNEKFNNILKTTVGSLEASQSTERKSILIQGAYGTGKSHASAVVKHLLWDDSGHIEEYLKTLDVQLREKVRNFRKTKKVLPIVLKGIANITDNRTFSLAVEKALKDTLKANNVEVQTESDFEKMVAQIKDNPLHIDWNQIIKSNQELRMYVNSPSDLVNRLKNRDITILKVLESIINKKGGYFIYSKIDKWLLEIAKELSDKGIANHLMIFWDEFSAVLQHSNRNEFLSPLQDMAELSKNGNIFLYLISHRTPHQAGFADEEVKKVFDRFHFKDYSMEPITTYHIISAAIQKKDEIKWNDLKDRFFSANPQLNELLERISGNEGVSAKNNVKNLFPIHPYAAYLATFIARNLGSTERSIFSFLNDKDKGFLNFLNNETDDKSPVISADYLWDYFIEEFEKDNSDKFLPILEKFKLHIKDIESLGKQYIAVFKGTLLLNALYRMVSVGEAQQSLVLPSVGNIQSLFIGTFCEPDVDRALGYFDKKEIIRKTPDELYLVSFSIPPVKEIEAEKQKALLEYEDITKVLEFNPASKTNLTSLITNGILRTTEVNFYWVGEKEHILRSKLSKGFRKTYSLHLAIFLQKDDAEASVIKNTIKQLAKEEDSKHSIFIFIDKPFGKDRYNRFITFYAESVVARNHNFNDDAIANQDFAKKVVDDWINSIRSGYVTVILNGEEKLELMSKIGNLINEQISPRIFRYGLENLQKARENQNVWTYKMAQKSIEIFLFANSRDDISSKTSRGQESYLRCILKDKRGNNYVVEENLEIKETADKEHPLVKISGEVEGKINDLQDQPNFNLGDRLRFLSELPYGIYSNMIHMALMGYVLRKYIGKLYEAGTGRPITQSMMKDKTTELFRCWQEGISSSKLEVRLGTLEEKELVETLGDIFSFDNVNSLNDLRWEIRKLVKDMGLPIWSVKYLDVKDGVKNAVDEIFILTKNVDSEIGYDDVKRILEAVKNNKLDLELTLKKDKIQQGFIQFLQYIDSVSIFYSDIGEIIDYLYKNMQEEVAQWEIDKVESKVKDWWIKKQTLPPETGIPGEIKEKPPVNDVDKIIYKEQVKERLMSYSGDLKPILLKILDAKPDLAYLIDKYLNSQ